MPTMPDWRDDMAARICAAALLTCFIVAGCSPSPQAANPNETLRAADGTTFGVETVVSGLEVPWAITFTPDGLMLITERPGRVRVVEKGKLRPEAMTIADVETTGEAGLMDLILHPEYRANRLIYLSYVYRVGDDLMLRVARYRFHGDRLERERTIIEGIPAARLHAGCRLGFGPDGKLYVTAGDAGERELAQKLDSLAGKTLRLEADGSVPRDNPFVSKSGVRPEIWSYGHRNAQGIDWQPRTGLQFQSEHGPSGNDGPGGGDEVNIVERGKNYGWPAIHHRQTREGMIGPLLEYTPAIAPASGRFYSGAAFASFVGDFFIGCLRGEAMVRVRLDGRKVLGQERLLHEKFGRIRAITMGPDGVIYFSTSNRDGRGDPAHDDDRIMRLVPKR